MNKMSTTWRTIEGETLFWFHRIVGKMIRWQINGKPNLSLAQSSGKPILWTFWHEQMSPFVMFGDRFVGGEKFCIIRVGDERGDILGHLAKRLGGNSFAVDMQGNPVAAGRSVLRVIQAMKTGKQTLLAPDGPDGPPFEPKAGVAYLARKSEAVVIPVGAFARPLLRIPRWDQYQIPLPFSTIHMQIGEPIFASKRDKEEQLLIRITSALSKARYHAQGLAGVTQWP